MKKRIVFLYSSLNGFVISTLRALMETKKVDSITVIHWDKNRTSGNLFQRRSDNNIKFFSRSKLNKDDIVKKLLKVDPHLIYISGWMDKEYIAALREYRKQNKTAITVCGIDDQWRGTLRQHLGKIFYKLYFKNLFDRIWVSGAPQYHFARQIGYDDRQILFNLLSADTNIFGPTNSISKRFVFVGRLEHQKGPDTLIAAYELLPIDVRRRWPLIIIGDGQLRSDIEANLPYGATLLPYMQPDALYKELAKGGIGCQPSRFEQWGVSIHELTLLGYPLIVSTACGAATEFVIDDFNGFYFPPESARDIATAMKKCIRLNDMELERFSQASKRLGARISPDMAAYSLLSSDASWRLRAQK